MTEIDDLSDWLEYHRDTTLDREDWDDTIEFEVRTPNTKPHEVSEDDVELLADSEGIKSWHHDTGQWQVISDQ